MALLASWRLILSLIFSVSPVSYVVKFAFAFT